MNALQRFTTTAAFAAATGALAATNITVNLTTSYVKIMENAGTLKDNWTLAGITAFNGSEQVAFACVSNRPYTAAKANSTIGELPAGDYIHQLSVFNTWDGVQTRSYRVQIAQPDGTQDIYAYCPCLTISQPGVNLVDYPDIRELRSDNTKIYASYTESTGLTDALAAAPVTAIFLKTAAYIESDGTSGILTGYKLKSTTRIEVDFAVVMTNGTSTGRIFGADRSHTALKLSGSLYVDASGYWRIHVGNGTNYKDHYLKGGATSSTLNMFDAFRHTAVIDYTNKVFSIDGINGAKLENGFQTSPSVYPVEGSECIEPLALFARQNASGVFEKQSKSRIYGVKIYEGGELVHDFRPFVSSGVPGFRDAKTLAFICNGDAPDGAFTAVGASTTDASPYVETLRSDSRYIDTGYMVTGNTKVAIDYAPAEERTAGDTWYLFCAKDTHNYAAYINDRGFGFINSASWKMDVGADVGASAVNVRRTAILDNPESLGVIVTKGVTNATCATATGGPFNRLTLKLATQQNAAANFASIRIYGCKIWEKENGEYVLKRDYVPTVENDVAGLRDATGNDTTFRQGSGTSQLTYGGAFTPTVTPATSSVYHGQTATLTASAPGAVSYRWLKNGEDVPGVFGATLAAAYGGVGVVDSYQAIAVYTIDEATMESDPSAPVTVEGKASATTIIIR